jgi:hypothetical protein
VDEDAYGRVTNPERYRLLHEAARDLLARLEGEYDVERSEGLDVDPGLAAMGPVDSVVRLSPRGGEGAPVTLAFTGFPGIYTRSGETTTDAFPRCGCDACDEDPHNLVEDLTGDVLAVTEGRFGEDTTVYPPWPRREPPP